MQSVNSNAAVAKIKLLKINIWIFKNIVLENYIISISFELKCISNNMYQQESNNSIYC